MINWERLYYKLLENKKHTIGENHHVIPKHDGGTDGDGIVKLPRRYHILGHFIRYKWKKQVGDKVSYLAMSGQITNPMHNSEMKKYHAEVMKSKKVKLIHSKAQQKAWNDSIKRNNLIIGRQKWIDSLPDKKILTTHMQTEQVKEKRNKSRKKYLQKVNKNILKQIGLKAAKTKKERFTDEQIRIMHSNPGKLNGKWKGYFIIEKNGIKEVFETRLLLQRTKHIDFRIISKYMNTNKEVKCGNLAGYKIFNIKII